MNDPTSRILPPGVLPRRPPSATHWSLVRAGGDAVSPGHQEALEQLARQYWFPLFDYARRQGCPEEDARDLTQSFLSGFLSGGRVGKADPRRGRFRTFLLTCFRNPLRNQWNRSLAARRGGDQEFVPLDANPAGEPPTAEPVTHASPDRHFDRAWAVTTLDRALAAVRREYVAAGKAQWHDELRSILWEEPGEETYRQLGTRLSRTEAAVKMAVARLRHRCRRALMEEIGRTVSNPADLEEEYRHLVESLRG